MDARAGSRTKGRQSRRALVSLFAMVAVLATALAACGQRAVTAQIPVVVGVTHTQYSGTYPSPQVTAATSLLAAQSMPQNQYLMGWGVGNPEPSPGVYDWSGLDRRMDLIRQTHGIPVLTLAGAPDWMKGGQPGTTDWSEINTAPTKSHYGDFAALAAAAAKRYPQVRYFQVWSELKGFYDSGAQRWDYEGYTDLYNAVYDAVRAVRPDAQIGGPYVVLDTWSTRQASPAPSDLSGPWGVVDQRALDVVDYWNAHKHGAQFLAVDASTGTRDQGLVTDPFDATALFTAATDWLVRRTGLPVWWSEFYPRHPQAEDWPVDSPQLAALTVDAVARAYAGGAAATLLWQPEDSPDLPFAALWTAPTDSDPAHLLPLASMWQWLAVNLRHPDATVSWSAGDRSVTIVNKDQALTVNLTGRDLSTGGPGPSLPAYGSAITPRP
jgi:hypothetical protein